MSSQLSTTDICNLALDYLDEANITSFDSDTGSVARWFQRNFWPIAHSLMRKHPWNFAMSRIQLPASSIGPAFGWLYAYDIPANCLRVMPLTMDGTENGQMVPFKVESTQILTDMPPPLNIRYIGRISNTGQFDQQFADALAAALAQKVAHFITGKASYAQQLGQTLAGLISDAQMMNALEGTPNEPIDDYWEKARA